MTDQIRYVGSEESGIVNGSEFILYARRFPDFPMASSADGLCVLIVKPIS